MVSDDEKANWRRMHAVLDAALNDVTLPTEDRTAVLEYIADELPTFHEPSSTTYLVLGSYRGEHLDRLERVAKALSAPLSAEAILAGETPDIELSVDLIHADKLGFQIKFHLLASVASYIVGVYEKDSGGEAVELGLLNGRTCFNKSYVFPRDYYRSQPGALETRADAIGLAVQTWHGALEESDRRALTETRKVIQRAQEQGIDISEGDVVDVIDEREREGITERARYSWPHLGVFALFELADRLHPWQTVEGLLGQLDDVPGPAAPEPDSEFANTR